MSWFSNPKARASGNDRSRVHVFLHVGRPIPRIAVLLVSALATIAAFALAPLYTPTVLAAAYDAVAGPPHQCGGG
jgi:hypothetical protein